MADMERALSRFKCFDFQIVNGGEHDGVCRWRRKLSGSTDIVHDDGSIVHGDESVVTETTAPGHYPYHSFERVDVQGNMDDYRITSENTVP
ncbi:MAG: hypothetical protein JST22_19970 [Bacteroidetes bacterium]|nr:hypothetical protein [Bacteroidota bacterium]